MKASLWSLLDARPVRAMIKAGEIGEGLVRSPAVATLEVWPRAFSISRMARVASKPFITGMEMSVVRGYLLACDVWWLEGGEAYP